MMHNLFVVYFVNIYMFPAYPGPSSGGTALYIYIQKNLYL